MTAHKLLQNHTLSVTQDIQRVFGDNYAFNVPRTGLAPIKRIALMAESFFPRFDGVSQTVYNTLHYLQCTGREVLVFAPDDAPRQVNTSRIIPVPSFGVPQYPELRVGLPVNAICEQLDRFKPDLIHLFAPVSFSIRAIWYAR